MNSLYLYQVLIIIINQFRFLLANLLYILNQNLGLIIRVFNIYYNNCFYLFVIINYL